jgi:hypothetical protein
VTTVLDEKVRLLHFDLEELSEFYVGEVLPEATDANSRFISAMEHVHEFRVPEGLEKSIKEGSANMRRYAQDVLRELHYQSLRKTLLRSAHNTLQESQFNDLFSRRQNPPNSESAWRMTRLLQDLEVAYGNGNFGQATRLLKDLAQTLGDRK